MKVGIIGATGWLGSALGGRLLSLGMLAPSQLVLLNRSGPLAEYHGYGEVMWAADANDLVMQSDVIVASVRPEDWPALGLNALGKLVLSFMAGVSLSALAFTGGRVVRAMPNAASEIGRSYSPWVAAEDVTDDDRAIVRRLLSAIGSEDELRDEHQLDLMAAVPGSGVAYPALMAIALAEFLEDNGIASEIAWRAAEAVVCDAPQILAGRIAEAPAMIDAYLGYEGITAAGIRTAYAEGVPNGIKAAVAAAVKRAEQMARGR